MKSKCNPKGC